MSFLPNSSPNQAPPPTGLRVGLTGGLGSGKSTVAAMLASHGAIVFSADELARTLMQPCQHVYAAIVEHFGPAVVRADGALDRAMLARLAFTDNRVEELNAIIHPATIALQARLSAKTFALNPHAIIVTESALIFETELRDTHPAASAASRNRFDRLILVAAPEALKIARFADRSGPVDSSARKELEAEAARRLAHILPDERKAPLCDYVLQNDSTLDRLQLQVDAVWNALVLER